MHDDPPGSAVRWANLRWLPRHPEDAKW